MAKTRRAYTGASVETQTTTDIDASGTAQFTVSAATNWPYGTDPYYVVVSPGTASEEKILVTRTGSTDTTINIASESQRGQDGTSAVYHSNNSTIYPVFTAVDADEANELASTWTTKGDIVAHGASTFERLPVGTNGYVLQANSSAASGLAWDLIENASGFSAAVDAVLDASLTDYPVLSAPVENWNVVGSAPTGTINVDVSTASVWYYTSNASANFTLNFRGNGSTTLNSLVGTNDAITVAFVFPCGGTAYRPTTVQVDGTSKTVLYLGDYESARANSTNVFSFTLVKTASNTWTVLGSVGSYL